MKHTRFMSIFALSCLMGAIALADDLVIDQVVLQTDAAYAPESIVANPVVGQELLLTVYFTYDGAQVPGMSFEIRLDGNQKCMDTIANFESGGWVAYCSTRWVVEPGSHTVEAFLDTGNDIVESNEQNNSGSKTFDIQGNSPTDHPLFLFVLNWLDGDFDQSGLLAFLLNGTLPGLTPTATPTVGDPTATPTPTLDEPTPTPTEGGGTSFDFADYFILANNSTWHYTGIPPAGMEDDFRWTVESTTQDIGGGNQATRIRTDTDEPTDDLNGNVDFWFKNQAGQIFYYGLHLAKEVDYGLASIPMQDIVFTDPVLVGNVGMTLGQEIMDAGAGMVFVNSFLGNGLVQGTVTSRVQATEILPTFVTPLGTFTNVLRVVINLKITVAGQEYQVTDSTFFLKEGVGMIGQDQEPDPDDAQIQGIDEGQVGGAPIVAN